VYASSIVEERLELAKQELGFPLEYHSVSEADLFNSRMETKYEDFYREAQAAAQGAQFPFQAFQLSLMRTLSDKNNPRLSSEEIRWMINERYLCMCDAAYFGTRYFYLKNINNDIQRFTFQAAQKVYFQIISELEMLGISIEMLVNKARQLGVSTETELCIAHRILFTYGVSATIASADQSKTAEMANMLFLAHDMLPWWMPPVHTRRVESDRGMLVFGGQKSQVKFQHGSQSGGISQGTTPTTYHLSEVSYYPDCEKLIEVGLFKAVHASPKVFGVLESTACGNDGWWFDKYWYYKNKWPNCRMLALFLPWFMGTDLYPNKVWLRKSPVREGWRPRQETLEMISRAELYVKSNPVLEKVLGNNWKLPREQAWWWEIQFLEALDGGKLKTFYQEYPTDDVESFQGSYDNVFGREVIADVDNRRSREYRVFGIVGQSIEDKHEPDTEEVDYQTARIPVSYKSTRGETYRWELVPLQYGKGWTLTDDDEKEIDPDGKLFVFLPPEPGWDYSIGVDTSSGIGSDSTCIAVCRRAKGGTGPDVQAAEFRSSRVSHVEAFAFALVIAAYYAKHMAETTNYREPYVAIEQIAAVGDTCQFQMRKMGYGRFHHMVRYDSKKIKKSKAIKMGWFTNVWSRPMLTDGFVIAVQNGWYVVNSPWTIYEMDHWEVHLTASGKEKKEHSSKTTDDGIFANAMATFCPNDLEALTKRTKKRCQDEDGEDVLPPIDLGVYSGNALSVVGHGSLDRPRYDQELEALL
jgi:hypothetical protein